MLYPAQLIQNEICAETRVEQFERHFVAQCHAGLFEPVQKMIAVFKNSYSSGSDASDLENLLGDGPTEWFGVAVPLHCAFANGQQANELSGRYSEIFR